MIGFKLTDGNGNVLVVPWSVIIYGLTVAIGLGGQLYLTNAMRGELHELRQLMDRQNTVVVTLTANQNSIRERLLMVEQRVYKLEERR